MRNIFSTTIVVFNSSLPRRQSLVAKVCLNFGLQKIGKQVFAGKLKSHEKRKLEIILKQVLRTNRDDLFVIPICAKCHKNAIIKYIKKPFVEEKNFVIIG
jgi:CRISPR-associated endonuclease Cas2